MNKTFDQELYDKNDSPAKTIVRNYLDTHGYYTQCFEDFGADIKSYKPVYHEAEIKHVWKGEWPEIWDTVQIPYRKKRLLKINCDLFFWIISGDLKQACIINKKNVKEKYVREISNSEVKEKEKFYCIPLKYAKFIKFI